MAFATGGSANGGGGSSSRRIAKALYRQLLRWCETADRDVPISSIVPPVRLRSPEQVDLIRLAYTSANSDARSAAQRVRDLLPLRTVLADDRRQMIVPIHSASDLKGFFRAVFRLNADEDRTRVVPDDAASVSAASAAEAELEERRKARISQAFDALKSLNELSTRFQEMARERKSHSNRDGVMFTVGQVVQHREDQWRGVVLGWEKNENDESSSQKSSLTTKMYGPTGGDGDGDGDDSPAVAEVRYQILLDGGDAHTMGLPASAAEELVVESDQSKLSAVSDGNLLRVRSGGVSEHFTGFDAVTGRFVPNELLSYEYPADTISRGGGEAGGGEEEVRGDCSAAAAGADNDDDSSLRVRSLCETVVAEVQHLARRLEGCIREETARDQNLLTGKDRLISKLRQKLAELAFGDVFPPGHEFAPPERRERLSSPTPALAALHLRHLLNLWLQVSDAVLQRELCAQNRGDAAVFSVGDAVRHRVYGFRGIVAGWDPKPTADVSRWDGLAHITDQDPMELPFYHVVPDQGDCVEAFGGERRVRYVCQENLVRCTVDQLESMRVDLDMGWLKLRSSEGSEGGPSYLAPEEVRFKYGENLNDDGATERCMKRIQDEMNAWQLSVLKDSVKEEDGIVTDGGGGDEDKEVSGGGGDFFNSGLVALLGVVDNVDDALTVQETIKEIRKAHEDIPGVRWELDRGTQELLRARGHDALAIYEAVARQVPDHAEAWNKLATCQFMLGQLDRSLESTYKALALDPNHAQVRNGLGILHFERGEYSEAAECFRESIRMDPWSPVASKLSVCLKLMESAKHGNGDEGDNRSESKGSD